MLQAALSNLQIIVLNDFCYVQGGASRVAIDEALGLANAGLSVTFVGAVGPVCHELLNARLKVVCIGQSELSNFRDDAGAALNSLWNRKARETMASVLAPLSPRNTVVHVHGYTKSLSSSPIRLATIQGFKVVCTLHDFFAACPNGAFFNFTDSTVCHLQGLSASCITTNCDKRHYAHKLYRVARSLVQRHAGQFPSGVGEYIALSNKSAEVLRPYLPPHSRIRLLANPIEVERGPPVDVAASATITAIGRLDTEKGTSLLIDAARRTGSRVTLVGDGPWRQHAEKYQGCKVTGWLTRERVIEELRRARCLVFPSLWYETYGLVVEEAAACGVPAIVSDVSAAAERVKDGMTGWHLRTGDVDDLARCLAVIKDDDLVAQVGRAAYEHFWIDPPTPPRHTAALVNIYEDILAH
jgi:glycosyltransferase involved in cell wall biosynthesis